MIKKIIILLLFISNLTYAQIDIQNVIKKNLKFSTFYGAVNGGTSISDASNFSVTTGQLQETVVKHHTIIQHRLVFVK